MKKLPLLVLLSGLFVFSCSRRFECNCEYKQISFGLNADGEEITVITDTLYQSYISYTSKKLANEECDERGRSLMLDSLKIEASCNANRFRE